MYNIIYILWFQGEHSVTRMHIDKVNQIRSLVPPTIDSHLFNNSYVSNNNNDEFYSYIHSKFFVNLTNQQFPDEIQKSVRLGLKYSLESLLDKKIAFETIENTEHLLSCSDIPDDEKNFIKYDIIQDVRCSINKTRHIFYEDRMISQNLKQVKLFMDNNKIMFTNANKGNATVAINRED